jgi:hypothetical protein
MALSLTVFYVELLVLVIYRQLSPTHLISSTSSARELAFAVQCLILQPMRATCRCKHMYDAEQHWCPSMIILPAACYRAGCSKPHCHPHKITLSHDASLFVLLLAFAQVMML